MEYTAQCIHMKVCEGYLYIRVIQLQVLQHDKTAGYYNMI